MSVSQYNSYKEIIKKIDEMSKNTKEKGDAFEKLCKTILEKASFFHSYNIDKVWLWNDFPYKDGVDTGIDIIVKTVDDEYWAVQCKCFLDEGHITKESINSFLAKAASGFIVKGKKINYKINYLFHTTNEDFSKNTRNLNFTPFGPNELEQCGIDWSSIDLNDLTNVKIIENKKIRPHQNEALDKVIDGFKNNDRGQLIMACGTGKTFTSLKIVEEFIKTNNIKNSKILYLVPSIALLSQTVIEWSCQTTLENVKMFGICSDATAGKHKLNDDEYVKRMPIPSTTNINELSEKISEYKNCHQLIFSTYQSIDVVSEVQKQNNFAFDLIICDEAHRTIGSLKKDDTEDDISNFIKVHDNKNINGNKRLYMTATPKIYSSKAKDESKEYGYEIISMDDENIYGPKFYNLTFSDAISKDLLTDYRLVVMNINKKDYVNSELIKKFTDKDLEDNTKLFGVLSALSKKTIDGQKDIFEFDPNPIRRTVAFTKTIKQARFIAEQFNELVEEDKDFLDENDFIFPKAELITGSDSANEKEKKLNWLREDFSSNEKESRILTNAKCLSEGVDVPSLDAVAFITRRDSKVDIIQAIGRVMRKPNDGTVKKYGYIIIPVLLDSDKLTDEIIQKNKDFKLVLSVIQALISHDNRVDKAINIMSTGEKGSLPPNICFVNSFKPRYKNKVLYNGKEDYNVLVEENVNRLTSEDLKNNDNLFRSFLVKKIGNRLYWENWSSDIKLTVKNIANKITNKIEESKDIKNKFDIFLKGLKRIINPSITKDDAINMLAQHIVVLPILKAIFQKNQLINKNIVCQLMKSMNKELPEINEEVKSLDSIYKSVEKYLLDIGESSFDRQSLIKTLFDNFFTYVASREKDKFGIVYTPIEIVDFIINSVNDALQKEFGSSIIDKGIKILDPFTGTGTFITRLFEKFKELNATKEQIEYKYKNDVWCNEIMLLAYYISLINIEDTYNSLTDEFLPFEHDVFADTFQMYEDGKDIEEQLQLLNTKEFKNLSKVMEEENNQEIRIIIGNPPYSVGQRNANENNANTKYKKLEHRIFETYASNITSPRKSTLRDSYVKAFRWASDKIKENGIISFISNGGYVDNISFEGFRREVFNEFNSIYIYLIF